MPLPVLIVPDKFKGTLSAEQAAEAIARGWRGVRPEDTLELLPMSDGGDGFGEIISRILGAGTRGVQTVDAAHRPLEAQWWWHPPGRTAVIESAKVIGLAQLPPGKYHPFELDTFGLGAVLRDAAAAGATRCLLGIGGSATNDAGFGMARALGWQFFNAHEENLARWTELRDLAAIRPPGRGMLFEELIVAVDVRNPLLGPDGCSRVYGPQKGLTEFEVAEQNLERLATVLKRELKLDFAREPGAGAAGGLGFGLRSFAGARLESGFDLFARFARLEERIQSAHLVITGEGALDAQTLMGKGVGEIADRCRQSGVPCLGLAGMVPDAAEARKKFARTYALTPEFTTKEEAFREPALWLERLAAKAASEWNDRTFAG
jgi:glycerate kinase